MKRKFTLGAAGLALALGGAAAAVVVGNNASPVGVGATAQEEVAVAKVGTYTHSDWNFSAVHIEFTPAIADLSVWAAHQMGFSSNKYLTITDKYGVESNVDNGSIYNYGNSLFFNFTNGVNSAVNHYGDVLTIPADYLFAVKDSSDVAHTYHVTNEQKFICKVADGSFGDWEAYIAPTALTLDETAKSLEVGDTYTVPYKVTSEDTNPLVFFKSSDEKIATVSDAGVVTPVDAGSATITAYCGKFSADLALTVTVGKTVTGVKVTNENKTIACYKGNDWKLTPVTAERVFDDETTSPIVVSDDMLTGDVDTSTVGTYTVTLTYRTFTDTLSVVVSELPELAIGQGTASFGADLSGWNGSLSIVGDYQTDDIAQYVNLSADCAKDVASHILINGSPMEVSGIKNLGGARYIIYSSYLPKLGDTAEITAGLKMYRYSGTSNSNHDVNGDGEFYAYKEVKTAYKIVCTNSPAKASEAKWVIWTADPTDFTLSTPKSFVSVGEAMQLSATMSPDGSYGSVAWSSSDTSKATIDASGVVTGVAEGPVTITATLGEVTHTIDLTVEAAKEIASIKYTDAYNYYSIPKGADTANWKPTLTKAKYVYADDTTSPEFDITDADYTVEAVSSETVGDLNVKVTLTKGDVTKDGTIAVKIYEYIDEKIKTVAIVDWFAYSTFIQIPNTGLNKANLTDVDTSSAYISNIDYTRKNGDKVNIQTVYQLGTNIALFPSFIYDDKGTQLINSENFMSDGFYQVGDRITIKKDTPVYQWTGDVFDLGGKGTPIDGTGEKIVEGHFTEAITYRLSNSGWQLYVATTELVAANDTLDVKVGKTALSGITRGPSGATSGTIKYTSSDATIATVNETTGVIAGVKPGKVTVTALWTDEDDSSKTFSKSITVNVVDYEVSLTFATTLEINTDEAIDLSKTDGVIVYKSGATAAVTDWTGFTIDPGDFDNTKAGTYEVTVSGTVNGNKVSGKLSVKVNAKAGCGGAIAGSVAAGVIALAGVIGLAIKRRKSK